jgi:hypothetical protein
MLSYRESNEGNIIVMHKAILIVLLFLLTVAIFDPADKIFHMKVLLFSAVWALTATNYFLRKCPPIVPLKLLIYVLCFSILIPLWSICWYFLQSGVLDGYDGFQYLKGYLFLSLCIPLALEQIDIVPALSILLTIQAALASLIYILTAHNPVLFTAIHTVGDNYGIFAMGTRTYAETEIGEVYFVTSPLLAISVAYYTYGSIVNKNRRQLLYMILLIVNVAGMFRSGTRNNIIASFMTLFIVWLWYAKRKIMLACSIVLLIATVVCIQWSAIQSMLATTDRSNAQKIGIYTDYIQLLSEPKTLLLGQGQGSPVNLGGRSRVTVSELTYMELLRGYGILFGVPMLFGLFYPLSRLARHSWKSVHFLYIGYGVYLYLSALNPLLVSSSGMLLFSVVLAQTFSAPQISREASSLDQSYSTA